MNRTLGRLPHHTERIEQISPIVHQLHPLPPVFRAIVSAPDFVLVLMAECRFDHIGIEAARIENGARGLAEAVGRHFVGSVPHTPQRRIHGVLRKRFSRRSNRCERQFVMIRQRPDILDDSHRLRRERRIRAAGAS